MVSFFLKNVIRVWLKLWRPSCQTYISRTISSFRQTSFSVWARFSGTNVQIQCISKVFFLGFDCMFGIIENEDLMSSWQAIQIQFFVCSTKLYIKLILHHMNLKRFGQANCLVIGRLHSYMHASKPT